MMAAHAIWRTVLIQERPGWVTFASILLLITGTLNVIYGIAAIGDSSFFVRDARYVISGLNTWGWVALGVGLIEVLAAGSLWRGALFGRILGICAASINAITALLSIPAYPFLSLVAFAISIVIIEQIGVRGTQGRVAPDEPTSTSGTQRAMAGMGEYKQ